MSITQAMREAEVKLATPEPQDISRRWFMRGLAGAFVLAFIVRDRALSQDFPLNDGGLFFTMTRDLQAAHYHLPAVTTYNHAHIPFAYPPLAFYIAGLLNDTTPMGLLTIFRLMPFVVSVLTVVAFMLLARTFLPTRRAALVASFAYALHPWAFKWLIMGGGLTRSLGVLFAILAIQQAVVMYRRPQSQRTVVTTGVLVGLSILSHLEYGALAAFSVVLIGLSMDRTRDGLRRTVPCALLAGLAVAPWAALVVSKHGLAPLVASNGTAQRSLIGGLVPLLELPRSESFFPILSALAVLGVLWSLSRRQYLLPLWLVCGAFFDPRGFAAFATIPAALLAGFAVSDVLLPLLRLPESPGGSFAPIEARRFSPSVWLVPSACCLAIIFSLLSTLASDRLLLTGLSEQEQSAMTWVRSNTAPSASVAIITGDNWPSDATSEWFPTLTARESVATVQGSEWISGGAFMRRTDANIALQKCSQHEASCLDAWSAKYAMTYDYVFVSKVLPVGKDAADLTDYSAILRASLRADPRYQQVYDGPAATIFLRKASASG